MARNEQEYRLTDGMVVVEHRMMTADEVALAEDVVDEATGGTWWWIGPYIPIEDNQTDALEATTCPPKSA